jgi:alpha-ribazole phosphatase/probable phosphoglycerate mutase
MPVEIIYETHSLTTDNEAGIATGWLPGQLSEEGRKLAQTLGKRRRNDGIAAVFVSDLRRAVETAEIAFAGSDMPVYQDARLRECNYGALNGMPVAQLRSVRALHVDDPYPGGQSYRQVVAQMRAFLRDLTIAWEGRKVAIIAHSANKWALDCLLNGAALEELVHAEFHWREGWQYSLPTGWTGDDATP